MLTSIYGADAINSAQAMFERRVAAASVQFETMMFGFQGGSLEAEAYRLSEADIWIAITDLPNRYWNALGVGDPFRDDHSIVVEINPPKSGINRRVSGLFLKDPSGNIHMAHRGRVGGGRKGIGKRAFREWYPNPFQTVDDCGTPASVIVIGSLQDDDFIAQLAAFIRHVAQFKHEVTALR